MNACTRDSTKGPKCWVKRPALQHWSFTLSLDFIKMILIQSLNLKSKSSQCWTELLSVKTKYVNMQCLLSRIFDIICLNQFYNRISSNQLFYLLLQLRYLAFSFAFQSFQLLRYSQFLRMLLIIILSYFLLY
ncbi:Hypothetical_protein [Hexamita inflata]|uniref:Hypothetical_protein n=1 Tax=Hexamita inflata TaxID=28002 RepID=A0AA86P632_9EUKA|nr:Hypothetical protein HINF_LOCUS19805 [Hexamita inflata]